MATTDAVRRAADPAHPAAPPVTDLLGIGARRRRFALWTGALLVLLVGSTLLGVAWGSVRLAPGVVAGVLADRAGLPVEVTWAPSSDAIVWQVRLPRVLLGIAVGAGLAVCGVALQAMVRNVLADPYLLGINSGASSGAAAAILFGFAAGLGQHALSVSAFLGAMAASALVYGIARSGGHVTAVRLLLAGVVVGYALYATTSFLIFASGSAEGARSVLFWLLGSLGLAQWGSPLVVVLVVVGATVVLLLLGSRQLDLLMIGDATARALGTSAAAARTRLLVLVSLCIGVVVAAAGSIGFVGLVVPHLARRAVGARHAYVVPVAALMGAILLVWADIVARTLLAPQEIPIGIITSLVGAPFLLILVRRLHASTTG